MMNIYIVAKVFNQQGCIAYHCKTPAEAQANGEFDYVYVPKDMYFLSKYGKILAVGNSEDEMREKMYEHYRAKYTYLY